MSAISAAVSVEGLRRVDGDPDTLAALARALGHPARVRIVSLLVARKNCIGGDIVDELGLAQSTVSEHLRVLKAAGIIVGEIERPRVCYSLRPQSLQPLIAFLTGLTEQAGSFSDVCCEPDDDRCRAS